MRHRGTVENSVPNFALKEMERVSKGSKPE